MTSRSQRRRIVAAPDDDGARLDRFLAAHVQGLSRRQARVLLDIGGVFVDGARVKVASRAVRAGQVIEANVGGALERASKKVGEAARGEDASLLPSWRVVFEDDDLVVVDKPAGLLTAPTPESDRGNLADALARRPGGGDVRVVHRIDLQTSGLLVFAKTDAANVFLSDVFRCHDVQRDYDAFVAGAFPDACTRIDLAIEGRAAVTHVRVTERFGDRATRLQCTLETGRTHQIRIHCRHVGHPILGDRRYGHRTSIDPPRMALHAKTLGFRHPRTGEPVSFETPLPEDLGRWLESILRADRPPSE